MSKARISLLVILASVMTSAALLCAPYTPAVQVQTVRIGQGVFAESVQLAGIVGFTEEEAFLNPFDGRVAQVCVSEGQTVRKGELLYRLDTAEAEQALAELHAGLYQYQQLAHNLDDSLQALGRMQSYETSQKQRQLQKQMEAAQIRSETDGIVAEINVSEGQRVVGASVAGRIHSEQKCVWAAGSGVETGTAAVISRDGLVLGTAVCAESGALDNRIQFIPVDETLHSLKEGERVTVEALQGEHTRRTLVPLGAVGTENEVWIVEDHRARPVTIDVSERNEFYVAVSDEWIGKEVILLPDLYDLTPGCAVKESGI